MNKGHHRKWEVDFVFRTAKSGRPALDDKIILSWNALMNTALSKAFTATGTDEYLNLAIANMKFLLSQNSKIKTTITSIIIGKMGGGISPSSTTMHILSRPLLNCRRQRRD